MIAGAFHASFGLLEHHPAVGLDVQGIGHAGDIVVGSVVVKGPAFGDQTANEGPNLTCFVFPAGVLFPVGYNKDFDLVLLLLQVQNAQGFLELVDGHPDRIKHGGISRWGVFREYLIPGTDLHEGNILVDVGLPKSPHVDVLREVGNILLLLNQAMQVALKDFLGCRGDGTHGPAFVQNQDIENIGGIGGGVGGSRTLSTRVSGSVGGGVGGIFDHSEVD